MALTFKPGWNKAIDQYVKKFGAYQAFLDTLTADVVKKTLYGAISKFNDRKVADFVSAVISPSGPEYTIAQGAHQPEDLKGGGFCLHFTGRDPKGLAFHFYIVQQPDGTPKIIEASYFEGGNLIIAITKN